MTVTETKREREGEVREVNEREEVRRESQQNEKRK